MIACPDVVRCVDRCLRRGIAEARVGQQRARVEVRLVARNLRGCRWNLKRNLIAKPETLGVLQQQLRPQLKADLREDDVFWCTADVGWVTGHSYNAYGPLAAGATIVMYEGAPTIPDGGRFWSLCEKHGVTIFYTAPTAIRALMKLGDGIPARYDLSKIRLLGSVGEPINPEAWMWYQRVIGRGSCPIVDTWWQTETGATMISPLPGVTATKPGSCTLPLPGIDADIVDDEGRQVTRPDAGGYLVIKRPWPFMLRTIWGDDARYLSTYWAKFHDRFYVAGDSAHRGNDATAPFARLE